MYLQPLQGYLVNPLISKTPPADIFKTWFAPADFVETVNTIGLPRYAKQKVMDFEKGVIIHTQSNPLPINLKPRAVIKLTMS
ncbi:major capsid protein [Endozoicomonas sp.]|uniref:major capsid protein n=1 Tax=Endozoicomonas sp. TaxID=1892382 RepID=UPI00383A8E01